MKDTLVVKKATPLGARVWTSLLVFGFIGQIAWMVENVYFSTYIQKNITAAGWATSATVAASAIAAALATIFSAAWSDRVGKRRAFVCWGYILWGITTAAFALFGNGQVGGSVGLAVTLFVVMDCVMSAIGSTANDSAFSAWVTDVTDVTNRGVVDIVLSILPIVALIVIFAGFDGMTVHGNWTGFFLMLGGLTSAAGVLGLCIFRDSPALRPVQGDTYLRDVLYAFRPANIRANKMIYVCFLGMMFSGLAMQLWQPYMISLVEVTLGIDNYIPAHRHRCARLGSAVRARGQGHGPLRQGEILLPRGRHAGARRVDRLQHQIPRPRHAAAVRRRHVHHGRKPRHGGPVHRLVARLYARRARRRVTECEDGHLHHAAHGTCEHHRPAHHPGPSRSSRRRRYSPNIRAMPAATSTRMSCFWPRP